MALNTSIIVGRLTRDIELKTAGETTVANFTVAVDKPYNKNNDHPEANWIDCVAWGKTAEFLEKYFKKGSKVGITGSLQTRTYEVKDTKVKVKVTEILVSTVDFVESKNSNQADQQGTANTQSTETVSSPSAEVVSDDSDDTLPF